METNLFPSSNRINQLTAINIAKIITIIILLGFAFIYDITDSRQIIYLSLHIGYCVWWLLEQWLFPQRRQQIFQDSVNGATLIIIILFVGVFYALPGYFAFNNTNPLNNLTIVFSLTLYIFGSLINTSADVQKMTAKSMNAKLVKDGIWRSVRHVNYLGDLMRYTSFSIIAGSLWAFILPIVILLLYLQRINEKEENMSKKYDDFADYQKVSYRLIPWLW